MKTFTIRARHLVGELAVAGETYLGANGIQCPLEKAKRFRSRTAAERALMEEWYRLRNSGNKSVILSVVARS